MHWSHSGSIVFILKGLKGKVDTPSPLHLLALRAAQTWGDHDSRCAELHGPHTTTRQERGAETPSGGVVTTRTPLRDGDGDEPMEPLGVLAKGMVVVRARRGCLAGCDPEGC